MIPLPCRQKGGGPQLGAQGPHQRGPFGPYGADEEQLPAKDDDQDDEPDCFR